MLQIKRIKPVGCQVLVTSNVYGFDDPNAAGIITEGHQKGDLKPFQEVIAVGDDVKFVKPGDTVMINFFKYAVFKEDPNSVKALADNPIVGFRLNKVEMWSEEHGIYFDCILIDQRDVKYVIEDYDEIKYEGEDGVVKVEKPKVNLILPNNKLVV